ncbi:MAG: magnesium and cobalt transport protein CorA [Bacteroidetes bacterium]|nr:MAG: magnesium and cobalt transport protein CorA [Bacteroidota bacterium]
MKKQRKKHPRKKIGLPPGSVVFVGNRKVDKAFIHYLQFDSAHIEEKTFDNHSDITLHPSLDEKVHWYDIRGLHDTQLIEAIGKTFEIHPLILEDVANTHQRPKFEEYDKGIFIVIRALEFDKNNLETKTEQVGVYFKKGILISFQETDSDLFDGIRQRLHSSQGKIRQRGTDYLCYALLDTIADHYYIVLDEIESSIENLEEKILINPDNTIKGQIHQLKKELLVVRKSIYPLREAIGRFSKSESQFIEERSLVFIRDLYDHAIQIMDLSETYRDMLNGLQDLYVSEISFKMNQVMQVLTLVATIFIPLTFLVGVYGMNFENIPELSWKYGYFTLWVVMVLIFISLLFLFRKKKWL